MSDSIEPMKRAEEVAASIIESALEVRSELGTGLLDEIYEPCILREFKLRGLSYKTDVAMPLNYEKVKIDNAYVIDILVEDSVIVKIKPVGSRPSLYEAHLRTYLRHSGYRLGLLLDFDAKLPKNCIKRVASQPIAGPRAS